MISAVILAAGESRRMGRPKMLLPWGRTTVIGHVVNIVQAAGVGDLVVVTGAAGELVEAALPGAAGVRAIFNPEFSHGEMLSSIQLGLQSMPSGTRAALICLGDQPQVREGTVRRVCGAFIENESELVVPSYHMRRGHPWLIARPLWNELLTMTPPQTPREFLHAHAGKIQYVEVDTPTVVQDVDNPEDYRRYKPGEV